ncbi:CBS domain-containing protein [Glycomyces sp. NPDC046736]|uniref:CBS domain-containing protein n=1 Tax=Glycomyces sp. NPDC046736 TaxID=3155615 RepID=UPI0033C48869
MWIDHLVALVPQAPHIKAPVDDRRDVTLRIGHLASANRKPETARLNEPLMDAITRMGANRHSQLAVLGENGSVEGALSEGGIMRAFARGPAETVADATESARLVRGEEHVLELLDVVERNGFVIVVDREAQPVGLVTAAELLAEFVTRHRPILTVASIELHIRQRVSTRVDPNEIAKFRPRWARGDPSVFPTLGQYPDLLAKAPNWDALDWRIDKTYFLNTLRKVARIRNDLAHFEADPLTESQLQLIDSFLTVLLDLTQK